MTLAPLTDAETKRICDLWEKTRLGLVITESEASELDLLVKRIKIKNWPPPVIPPGQLHPQITIPKPIPASMLATVESLINQVA